MAYVAPSTRSTGDLITAAIWNQDIVDNMIAVKALVDAASFKHLDTQQNATEQQTTSASWQTTATWTFTPTATDAAIILRFEYKMATAECQWAYQINSDSEVVLIVTAVQTTYEVYELHLLMTGLNAGSSNTFKLLHKASSATGRIAFTDNISGFVYED